VANQGRHQLRILIRRDQGQRIFVAENLDRPIFEGEQAVDLHATGHEEYRGDSRALDEKQTSAPVFAGLTWVFRLLAPTRPRLGGLLIGLASGGAGAVAYAFYCPEQSPAFLLAAYTTAMLVPALAGAAAGPRLLKW